MVATWAVVVLFVYPAIQLPLLWLIVRRFDLRNDDGPRDPLGYSFHGDAADGDPPEPGRCANCGRQNVPAAGYCAHCITRLH